MQMTSEQFWQDFLMKGQKYRLSKTLRFELIPIGKTKENIKKNALVEEDVKRGEDYQKLKVLLDEYHKFFIDDVLRQDNIPNFDWEEFARIVQKEDETAEKAYSNMRNNITKLFVSDKRFSELTATTPEKLLKTQLMLYIENCKTVLEKQEAIAVVNSFQKFATYFIPYQETRKNIYKSEEIATSIPYRIVNDNFPKFLENCHCFKKIKENFHDVIKMAQQELKDIIHGENLDFFFEVNNYKHFFTQKQIDLYNTVIGGATSKEKKEKIKGLNELLNLYYQQNQSISKQKIKFFSLCKQILSDKATVSFVIDKIENDKDFTEQILDYGKSTTEKEVAQTFSLLKDILQKANDVTLKHIYLAKKDINTISQSLFGNWAELQNRINLWADATFSTKKEKNIYLQENSNEQDRMVKATFSLFDINKVLEFSSFDIDDIEKTNVRIQDYLKDINCVMQEVKEKFCIAKQKLIPYIEGKLQNLREDEKTVECTKEFLDTSIRAFHLIKPFITAKVFATKSLKSIDGEFYEKLETLEKIFSPTTYIYDKARNYITQKICETKKYKLNFQNPTLLSGWDINNEIANTSLILIKDNKYYLGVMNKSNKPYSKKGTRFLKDMPNDSYYKKMVYKQIPNPYMMLPKIIFSKSGESHFCPSEDIIQGYKKKIYTKGDNFDLGFCHKLIDFYKRCLKLYESWNTFDFNFSPTSSYKDISEFYNEVATQGYKLSFEYIAEEEVNSWINEGKLYLFEIHNKDFAQGAKGMPNLHTLYWKALFSDENLKNVMFKLNGGAELFFRPSSIKRVFSHKKGEKLVNKITKSGNTISDDLYIQIIKSVNQKLNVPLSKEAKKLLDKDDVVIKDVKHEIIKDKRYTQDKFFFHVPITINFKEKKIQMTFNKNVLGFLKGNSNVNIIGLDRGERNLIYLCLINQKGQTILQKSFNIVQIQRGNQVVKIDYYEKLDTKEKQRNLARKNWKTIQKIAELKEGYLSCVIHEIAQIMVEYNAIIVMEDLNFGFKRGRFHIEKQVYQKFEAMLIKKLNYLVFKDKKQEEVAGVFRGLQLTSLFTSFKDLGLQSGFLFYVKAGYTSKIDPTTGFVSLFNLKGLTNVQKKRDFFSKFICICYEKELDCFAFSFDYNDFEVQDKKELLKTKWTIYSFGQRIQKNSNTREYTTCDITKDLKDLFLKNNIDYSFSDNLLGDIEKQDGNIKFFDCLYRLFCLILQMRNSNADEDYIISPVKNKMGEFFDSRREQQKGEKAILPVDAYANGAYHIALKGLYLLQRLGNTQDISKFDRKIKDTDWFNYRQKE